MDFQKFFFEALQERSIRVVPGVPIKLKISLAQGSEHVGFVSRIRFLAAVVRFLERDDKETLSKLMIVRSIELYSLPLTNYGAMAEKLAEASANYVVIHLRKKEEEK